jgi:sodium/bile acid cotransporter 7
MKYVQVCLCLAAVFLLLSHWHLGFAAEALTDSQKKRIVYDMYDSYKRSFPEVEDISVGRAMALVKSGRVVFVDTRNAKEQRVSMLPGAITEKVFKKNLERYKDHIVIGYCTISYRSGKLAKKFEKKGVKILNLKGGILAWVFEGGKIYNQQGETKQVHVYSKKWNYVPTGFVPVW